MKLAILAIASIAIPTAATAQSLIERLCGPGHPNEIAAVDDVRANEDGFYVKSLDEQVRNGDPRLFAGGSGDAFLCTRSSATPAMEHTKAILKQGKREVKYLFVPAASTINRAHF